MHGTPTGQRRRHGQLEVAVVVVQIDPGAAHEARPLVGTIGAFRAEATSCRPRSATAPCVVWPVKPAGSGDFTLRLWDSWSRQQRVAHEPADGPP